MLQEVAAVLICVKTTVKGTDAPGTEIFSKGLQAAQVFMGFTDKSFFCRGKHLFIDRERHLSFFRQYSRFYGEIPLCDFAGTPVAYFGEGLQLPACRLCNV